MDVNYLLGIGEPAVKEHILCPVASVQGGFQQLHHDGGTLLPSHDSPLAGNRPLVEAIAHSQSIGCIR